MSTQVLPVNDGRHRDAHMVKAEVFGCCRRRRPAPSLAALDGDEPADPTAHSASNTSLEGELFTPEFDEAASRRRLGFRRYPTE